MKPDRHKQEKNAIYKKKHGITDGTKQEHKVNEQFRDSKMKDKTHTAGVGPNTCRTPTSGSSDGNASKKLGLSDKAFPSCSEETALEMPEANYGRRKVFSNWKRYEIEESTTPTVRSSDFGELLKSSASIFSHSQYRDELGLLQREDSKQNTPTKFLTLDCDDLANSLMCIPLHDRLGIETSVFEPLMIQQCFELSKESVSKYARALDRVEPSPVVAPDYTSTETSNRNAEEQQTVRSHDLSMEICNKASNERLLNAGADNCDHSPTNDSSKYVKPSTSSSDLASECEHKVQTSTDVTCTANLRQPELEVGRKTPLSSVSTSAIGNKMVAESKCGTATHNLKELENELDLLLAL